MVFIIGLVSFFSLFFFLILIFFGIFYHLFLKKIVLFLKLVLQRAQPPRPIPDFKLFDACIIIANIPFLKILSKYVCIEKIEYIRTDHGAVKAGTQTRPTVEKMVVTQDQCLKNSFFFLGFKLSSFCPGSYVKLYLSLCQKKGPATTFKILRFSE